MTITDLKSYAARMGVTTAPQTDPQAIPEPDDPDDTRRYLVTLTPAAVAYLAAHVQDRLEALDKSLADPKTKPARRTRRLTERAFIHALAQSLITAEQISHGE